MKTDSPAPDHEELKTLLANSFHSEEATDVPPLPDDLRDRIRDQYGKDKAPAPPAPVEEKAESFFTWMSRIFAQPAFRGAAAALVLIAVAAVLLFPKDTDENRGVLRGEDSYTGVTIILYGFDAERARAIAKEFDPKAVKIVEDLAGQVSDDGRTIVLDGKNGRIEGYRSGNAEPQVLPLPGDLSDIVTETAKLSVQLKK